MANDDDYGFVDSSPNAECRALEAKLLRLLYERGRSTDPNPQPLSITMRKLDQETGKSVGKPVRTTLAPAGAVPLPPLSSHFGSDSRVALAIYDRCGITMERWERLDVWNRIEVLEATIDRIERELPSTAAANPPVEQPDSTTPFDEDEMRDALDPVGFHLLKYMLGLNQASYDKLAKPVWDDDALFLTDAAVHGAKNDVNKFLRKKGYHRELTKPKGEKILRWKHV